MGGQFSLLESLSSSSVCREGRELVEDGGLGRGVPIRGRTGDGVGDGTWYNGDGEGCPKVNTDGLS